MPRLLGPKPIEVPPRLPWEPIVPEPTLAEKLRAWPRSRWVAVGLSVLATFVVMTGFLLESRWGYSKPVPKIVYVESWSADRSEADLAADRDADRAALDARLAGSRAYIATLPPKERAAAQAQYDNYVASLKPSARPPGWTPPPEPAS